MMTIHGGPRRQIAVVAAAAMLASLAATQLPSPAQAQEGPLPGVALVVPVTDVTRTDADLGSVAHEVVVVSAGADGPRITKLRTRSTQDARTLAADLDAQPGVSAELNSVLAAPNPTASPSGTGIRRASRVDLTTQPVLRAAALPTLAAEPLGPEQWGLWAVNAEAAWAITQGSGVTVAVVDSGIDATHPDLSGRVLRQIDLVQDGSIGDPEGHGTHVAGIIAAALDGAGSVGLANAVGLLSVRVLDDSGSSDDATVARGIIEAVNAGAQVINLSLGGQARTNALARAVQFAIDRGVTVVAAGGNEYADGNASQYPAALPGVVGVASIDAEGASSWFSNTGAYIDLAAPGEAILSTVPGGGWAPEDGTSMAAPFVSAAAALVRAANPTLTGAAVDSALMSTARDDLEADGRDDWFGYGLVQADRAALTAALAPGGLRAPNPKPASIGTAQPAPAVPPVPTARVKVKATAGRSKLLVDVNPNEGSSYWKFQVQSQRADGSWKALKTYRTRGRSETRTINLKKGTYRVVVAGKFGYQGATSEPVHLRK